MDSEYTQRLAKIEAVLTGWLPASPDRSWATAAFDTMPSDPAPELLEALTAPGVDLVARGGKRWRPLFMVLACEALGGGEAALPLVPLVEFPHNASLIHDDIEDGADERRGKPAAHLLYGVDAAINSGSFLYFLPLACLDSWEAPPESKLRVSRTWGEHLRRLHLGQAMDIAWHRNIASVPTVEQYDLMCRMKTGVLSSLAAKLGAYAADAGEEAASRLGTAAEDLGVAFQILDDVKNLTTGNPGKKRGDDVVEGKKSLPIILFLREDPSRLRLVERCFSEARRLGVGAPETEELIAALEVSGALDEAARRGAVLASRAFEALETSAFPDGAADEAARKLLVGLARSLG